MIWIEIIILILKLIIKRMPKDEAVRKVSREFGVSEDEIWRHGGF